ncbi:hypothetical protein [Streptomyces palmae]|uniref:Uncharacterized protein n=1 Tax=Streptomyces palmae TaxID=1701085 RepID=A0A4Z0HBD6_9ACTN|nr:hypothetical protein [Streptomyces palmae]TGB13274.1 hypothetical protein E4099_10275 [Streptomyces palmae]
MTAEPHRTVAFTDPDAFTDPTEVLDEMDELDETDELDTAETAETGTETPEGDRVEQRSELNPRQGEPPTGADLASATEFDRLEQARVIELNEDEYR